MPVDTLHTGLSTMAFYTEEKITINTLTDITGRPKYQDSVRPLKPLFRFVLAAYSFPRKIACCSVSNCYQNHKKGYLVRTKDGGDCSLCESCAKRFMDPSALKPAKATRSRTSTGTSTAPRTRAPAVQAATRQITLETYITESANIKQRVQQLKQMPKGANWLYQSLSQFQKACPPELLSALKELQAKKEESAVFESLIENDASDQQLQDIEQLEGLDVFTSDIRQLLIERVLKPLTELDAKAKEGVQSVAIPVDWIDQVEQNFVAAETLIAEAQIFFTDDNIKRLHSIPLEDKAAKAFRSFRWDCDKGAAKKG